MGIKERVIWIALLIIILISSVFITNQYKTRLTMLEEDKETISSEYTKVKDENQKLLATIDNLNVDLKTRDEKINNLVKIDQSIIKNSLKNNGFKGEVKDIEHDLLNRPELIPYEGILGGTMHFYEEGIHVITDKWVVAYFDDGHYGGYMLLSYDLKNEEITWKVIVTYLY